MMPAHPGVLQRQMPMQQPSQLSGRGRGADGHPLLPAAAPPLVVAAQRAGAGAGAGAGAAAVAGTVVGEGAEAGAGVGAGVDAGVDARPWQSRIFWSSRSMTETHARPRMW